MMNLEQLDWDNKALELLGIEEINYHNLFQLHMF